MYYPTLDEVRQLKKHGNLVPVYREVVADLDTPVSAFLKIAKGNYSFLLESVEGGERLARYSFIGTEPSLVLKAEKDNPTDPLPLIEACPASTAEWLAIWVMISPAILKHCPPPTMTPCTSPNSC